MGSKLLGVLRNILRWSYTGDIFKKLILKNRVFKKGNGRKTGKRKENGRENGREVKTGTRAGTRTGAGRGTGAGTGNVFDPSNAGYPYSSQIYTKQVCDCVACFSQV
jgi:hypothetical protein